MPDALIYGSKAPTSMPNEPNVSTSSTRSSIDEGPLYGGLGQCYPVLLYQEGARDALSFNVCFPARLWAKCTVGQDLNSGSIHASSRQGEGRGVLVRLTAARDEWPTDSSYTAI